VRDFFIGNARYWLDEYRFDGLRFDAVHAIVDRSPQHILEEMASEIKKCFTKREIHLVLENDANQAHYLKQYNAQWNDDAHHAFHVLATGESQSYYLSYIDAPAKQLARCLAEGFAYQAELSPFSGKARGEPSLKLPPTVFVDFLQNHDQIGNRAFGERLISLTDEEQLRVLTAILLLAPSVPMLFLGEVWGCRQPFQFFCDFPGELGEAVRAGRRREFPQIKAMPDPLAEDTFRQCGLSWQDARTRGGKAWLAFYRELLHLRQEKIVPLKARNGRYRLLGRRAFEVTWDGLVLLANVGDEPVTTGIPQGKLLWSSGGPGEPWSAGWWLT
jgi:maltooligosyltrehalose trehalohydrolase